MRKLINAVKWGLAGLPGLDGHKDLTGPNKGDVTLWLDIRFAGFYFWWCPGASPDFGKVTK